jgi:diguanylate cyclase (GGDEF)-like protein
VHLDVATLIFVTVFINAMAGGLMIFSWLHSRGVTALLFWGAAYLSGAVAAALLGARDVVPDVWSIAVANALLLSASGLTWCGVRNFDGRPIGALEVVGGAVIWLAACSLPSFYASLHARATLGSLIAAAYAALIVWDLWRGRRERLMSRWLAMGIMAFHGSIILARIPATWMATLPPDGGLLQLQWLPIGIFEGLFFSFAAAFILLTMAKERAENRHKRAAFIDPLTGVPNRRGFFDRAALVLARCREAQAPVALLLFDLDHFKRINDTFGHQAGDDTLVAFCRTARATLRSEDVFARLGGEEFVCLMPEASLAMAHASAERIRAGFASVNPTAGEGEVHATVSVGMASSEEAGRDLTSLLGAADKALYQAKAKGRNRVEGRRPALSVVSGSVAAPLPRGAA